jgi:predicted GTPase
MTNTYNCVLLGESGSGKSSFGNYVAGENVFEISDDPISCTKDIIRAKSKLDPKIGIVDTPGISDCSGSNKAHYEKMLKAIKEMGPVHLILIILNFTSPRLTVSLQNMIKFLCNVFPNFAQHVGIVFTHYDHDFQMKINKSKTDPRDNRKNIIINIMKLISKTTNEDEFLGLPIYYLDSYLGDDNSKNELNKIISFVKLLKPIEDIKQDCNSQYLKIENDFITREEEIIEGNYIVTYKKKLQRKKYTDYNNNVTFGEWELVSADKSYRSL